MARTVVNLPSLVGHLRQTDVEKIGQGATLRVRLSAITPPPKAFGVWGNRRSAGAVLSLARGAAVQKTIR